MINIKSDSRKVQEGDTFIALPSAGGKEEEHILDAISKGAKKIICSEGSYPVETIIVPDTRKYFNEYLYNNYYKQISNMKFIGVTGTNGKTTTCYLIYQILNKLGMKSAYIGTIGFYYPGMQRLLNNTTPDTNLLYEMFLEAKEAGCETIVMEVSSHALDMNRIYGIEYDEVAFTNLTQDHLDYHKTLEEYAKAKEKLFTKTRGNKISVINADDPNHNRFMKQENHNITISDHKGDVIINNIDFSNQGTSFSFTYDNKKFDTFIHMVGRYNIYNYLTALMLVVSLGYKIDDVLSLNESLQAPCGRMELIPYKSNSIFVDYAHTPDAVLNVLESAQEYRKGKIITIVGCGGDRDRTKRPIMGSVAIHNSDYVIYTSDNPRTEDPKKILDDILEGVDENNYEVIINRKEAILKGMSMLSNHDILMILGKGHEDYQIIGKEKIHFSDQEIVKEYIEQNQK